MAADILVQVAVYITIDRLLPTKVIRNRLGAIVFHFRRLLASVILMCSTSIAICEEIAPAETGASDVYLEVCGT